MRLLPGHSPSSRLFPFRCTDLLVSLSNSTKVRLSSKIDSEYRNAKVLPAALLAQQKGGVGPARPNGPAPASQGPQRKLIEGAFELELDSPSCYRADLSPTSCLGPQSAMGQAVENLSYEPTLVLPLELFLILSLYCNQFPSLDDNKRFNSHLSRPTHPLVPIPHSSKRSTTSQT